MSDLTSERGVASGHKRLVVSAVPPGDGIAWLSQEKPAARAGDWPDRAWGCFSRTLPVCGEGNRNISTIHRLATEVAATADKARLRGLVESP